MGKAGLMVAADFDGTFTNSLGDPKTNRQGRRYAVFLHAYARCAGYCSTHGLSWPVPIPSVPKFCQVYREHGIDGLIKPYLKALQDDEQMVLLATFKAFFEHRLKLYDPEDLDCDFIPDDNLKAVGFICERAALSIISYRSQGRAAFIEQCRRLKVVGSGALEPDDLNVVGKDGATSAEAKALFLRMWYKRVLRQQKAKGWKPIAIGDNHKDMWAAAFIGFPVFIGVTETGEDGRRRFEDTLTQIRESDGVEIEVHLFSHVGHPECLLLIERLAERAK